MLRFAADVEGHAGQGQQISLVRGVDEAAAAKRPAALHVDRHDVGSFLRHAVLQIQSFAEHDLDAGLAHQRLHDLLSHVRFEGPHRLFARLLPPTQVLRALLELPGFLTLVVLPHTPVELAGDAANGLLVADVGGTQPAAGQSAQVCARLDQQRRLAHALHLDGRRDASRRAAVDDDIGHFCRHDRGMNSKPSQTK